MTEDETTQEYANLSALARVVIRRADLREAQERLEEAVDMALEVGVRRGELARVLGDDSDAFLDDL